MKKFLIPLLMLFSTNTFAFEWPKIDWSSVKWMEMKQATFEYAWNVWSVDPFLAPTYRAKNRMDLHVDMDFFNRWAFLSTTFHSLTDEYQFREGGIQYRLGVHVGDYVDLYMEHQSLHLFDYTPPMANSYDAVGVTIYLYRRDKPVH